MGQWMGSIFFFFFWVSYIIFSLGYFFKTNFKIRWRPKSISWEDSKPILFFFPSYARGASGCICKFKIIFKFSSTISRIYEKLGWVDDHLNLHLQVLTSPSLNGWIYLVHITNGAWMRVNIFPRTLSVYILTINFFFLFRFFYKKYIYVLVF